MVVAISVLQPLFSSTAFLTIRPGQFRSQEKRNWLSWPNSRCIYSKNYRQRPVGVFAWLCWTNPYLWTLSSLWCRLPIFSRYSYTTCYAETHRIWRFHWACPCSGYSCSWTKRQYYCSPSCLATYRSRSVSASSSDMTHYRRTLFPSSLLLEASTCFWLLDLAFLKGLWLITCSTVWSSFCDNSIEVCGWSRFSFARLPPLCSSALQLGDLLRFRSLDYFHRGADQCWHYPQGRVV